MINLHINGFHGQNRFMSNFVPVEVEFEGIKFPSVEHAYVAAKTIDLGKRLEIASVETAGQVKRIGRALKLRDDWESIKEEVMEGLLIQKFAQEPFRGQLLGTGMCYLEETNTWGDTFWGVCEGVGENRLGWLLMSIRDHLKEIQELQMSVRDHLKEIAEDPNLG